MSRLAHAEALLQLAIALDEEKKTALQPLELVPADDPVLLETAEVVNTDAASVSHLVKALKHAVHAYGGLGLAAPQVGLSERAFAIRGKKTGEVYVAINPQILRTGSQIVEEIEGCLSLPGQRFEVARPRVCDVEYFDPDQGKTVRRTLKGREARCFQHEFDHLEGILISRIGKECS